ncbi:MAG: SRPBCC family protein [Crocinitomicaceae bacterium]|nr:SRPBCC family protein [Crocinitomicaceae bacterium]
MPKIEIHTEINSSIEICFDLSRSIDLHLISTSKTKEKAIAGRTSGLVQLNDTVTWEATHFGVRQKLSSLISGFEYPFYFKDEQLKGAFKYFTHEHHFKQVGDQVVMTDVFVFESPFGILGRFFNRLVLTKYMRRFLMERNAIIKEYAESEKWKIALTRD